MLMIKLNKMEDPSNQPINKIFTMNLLKTYPLLNKLENILTFKKSPLKIWNKIFWTIYLMDKK